MTASETGPVGVLVVDDDPLVRAGLVILLGGASTSAWSPRPATAPRCWPWSTGTPPTWS